MAIDYWADLEEGNFYHIYNRSVISNELIFRSSENYGFFLEKFEKYIIPYLDIWSFCLLPDHFHFLAYVPEDPTQHEALIRKIPTKMAKAYLNKQATYSNFLEDQFKRFFTSYAQSFNKYYRRRGSLFQKRFRRVHIRTLGRVSYMICYHHHNPIHHNLTKSYGSWEFSSYRLFLEETPGWLSHQSVQQFFLEMGPGTDWKANFHERHRQFRINKGLSDLTFED